MPETHACEETYKECVASRKSRVEEVLVTAEPWETKEELAERAGVSLNTIKRAVLLQNSSPEPNCNNDYPPEDPTEQIVWYLNRHGRGVRNTSNGVIAWYKTLTPISRRALLKRLQEVNDA